MEDRRLWAKRWESPLLPALVLRPRLVVAGDEYIKYMGSRLMEVGTLIVTPGKNHSKIDENVESGTDQGESHLGIVRWVGNKLEHLQGKIGEKRPKGFPYAKDSMFGYALMKRA